MKKILTLFILSSQLNAAEVKFNLKNLASSKGQLLFLLFESQNGFPHDAVVSVRKGSMSTLDALKDGLTLSDLEDGVYAFTVFHDENSNGQLDKNFIGIPKEGFAFSQNPKVFFGPPSFKKSSFILKSKTSLEVKFIYF